MEAWPLANNSFAGFLHHSHTANQVSTELGYSIVADTTLSDRVLKEMA